MLILGNSQPLFLLLTLREEIQENTIRCALFGVKEELKKYEELVQLEICMSIFQMCIIVIGNLLRRKYSQNVWKTNLKRIRNVFPCLSQVIDQIKGKDYRRVAWMMQRKESQLMINQVCGDLLKQDKNIFLATIHDSILTTEQNVNATKIAF